MSDLVRAVIPGPDPREKNVGRSFAEAHDLKILDEPTHTPDGRPRPETRHNGRPVKARKQLAPAGSAAKKAVTQSADDKKEQDQ